MTDIILKDLLNILQVRYRDNEIVDQNIKESIAVARKDQDQLQIQNNCGEMHESINEQSVTHEIDEQASSQVVERTVIDEIDNVMGDDYVECPICDEGAMSGVIQCEECWMWLHYKCAGIPEDKVDKIPDSSPFICISCNDRKLYEDLVVKDDSHPAPPQIIATNDTDTSKNSKMKTDTLQNSKMNVKENSPLLEADNKLDKDRPINLKTLNSQVKNSDPVKEKVIQVDSYTSKINSGLECAPKQTVISKNSKASKSNVSFKRKSTCNTESNEIESKSLTLQLERQIRKKDKTINLLKQLNDSQTTDSSDQVGRDNASDQTQMQSQCKQKRELWLM